MIIKRMELQDYLALKPYLRRNQERQIVEEKLDAYLHFYANHPQTLGLIAYENETIVGFVVGCWKDSVYIDLDVHIEHFHVERVGAGRQMMERLLATLSVYEYNEVITSAGIENATIYENLCKKFNFVYSGGRAMSRKRES